MHRPIASRRTILKAGVGAVALTVPATAIAQRRVALRFAHQTTLGSPDAIQREGAVQRFRAENPHVDLTVEVSSHDQYLAQFNVNAAARALPDVFMINGADMDGVVNGKLIGDITDNLAADKEWGGALLPSSLTELQRNGRTYAVPYGIIVNHVIFWNESIFKSAGVAAFPKTWDELLAAVAKFKAAGVTPISLGNKGRWVVAAPYMGTLIHRTAGLDWFGRLLKRQAKFTDPEFVAAVTLFKSLVDAGAFNADANSIDNVQQRQAYFNGRAAMMLEGSWAIPPLARDARPEVIEATRLAHWPDVPNAKAPAGSAEVGAGWAYAISSSLEGEKRAAGVALLRKLSDVQFGKERLAIGLLPAQNLGDISAIKVTPLLSGVATRLASGDLKPLPLFTFPLPRSIMDTLGISMQELIAGRKTPDRVAADLQAEYDRTK